MGTSDHKGGPLKRTGEFVSRGLSDFAEIWNAAALWDSD